MRNASYSGWAWRLAIVAALLGVVLLWTGAGGGVATRDFSVVVIPDPQHYASHFPAIGIAQTQWIRGNVAKLRIQFVTCVGDCIDDGASDAQWKQSTEFMHQLDDVVPFGVACGNHDLMDGKGGFTSRKFLDHYGLQRFKKYKWYGGASASGFSSCQRFSGGGYNFLAIALRVDPSVEEIAWAKKVMAANAKMPVILTTHQFLTPQGGLGEGLVVPEPGGLKPGEVWDRLVKDSPQIFMVLCGHYHGEAYLVMKNGAGQDVHVILQDYQNEENGGNGWLRIIGFHPDKGRIEVQTYSPTLKQYQTGPKSAFSFDFDFFRRLAPTAISVPGKPAG